MKIWEKYPDVKFINQAKRGNDWMGTRNIGDIDVGEDVALNDAVIDITGGVHIGDRVHFGREVMVLSCTHPVEELNGLERRKKLHCGRISIRRDAYIGSRAIILEGVTIGEGSYIAAGAVVTKQVPDFELWGGVPAKLIRKLK